MIIYNKKEKIIFLIIFILIWFYLWLKAYYVPMGNDELGTFYFYVQTKNFLPYLAHWDANNHILNSAFTTLFYSFFGDSEIVLRLASLLSFPIFFYYCFKISEKLNNNIVKWSFVITLCLSHNFIEFFFLSRGYGMSMAFLFGSIYFLLQALENNLRKDYIRCLIFGVLALCSNLTLINSFLIIMFILFINIIVRAKEQKRYKNILLLLIIFIIGIIPIVFLSKYIIDLKSKGLLYYGNLKGFFEVTVKSISNLMTGSDNGIFPYIFILLFTIVTVIFISELVNKKFLNKIFEKHLVFYYLLTLNIIAILILAKLFKVNYPEDRAGIYLYPLLAGSIFFMIDNLILKTNKKHFLLIIIPFIFFPVNFLYSINLTHSAMYYDDRVPKRYFEKIFSEHKDGEFPASIGAYRCRHFTWDYMNYRHKGNLGVINEWDYPELFSEFQIGKYSDFPKWKKYYDSLDYDETTKYYLLKRKNFLEKKLIFRKNINTDSEISDEFVNLIEKNVDSLKGSLLYIGYKLTINTAEVPFDTWIVTEVRNKEDKSIVYKFIKLNCLKLHYDGSENNFINGLYINKLPEDADKIISYVWNVNKKTYSLSGDLYVYKVAVDY